MSAAASFISTSSKGAQQNVYCHMSTNGMCKLGNDYAMGLRWLRHPGYVHVSTNPVLPARSIGRSKEKPAFRAKMNEKIRMVFDASTTHLFGKKKEKAIMWKIVSLPNACLWA